jgi:PAS domain S-box-containing protein
MSINDNYNSEKAEELRKTTPDMSLIGFWELDLNTNEYLYSPELSAMLGYGPDEIPQNLDAWMSLVHEEDRKIVDPIIKEHKQNNKPYQYELRMKCKDGTYKWIEASGKLYKKDPQGVNRFLFGFHRDITERVQHKEDMLRKLKIVLEPEGDPGELELSDVLDVKSVQTIMDKFHAITHIGVAIADLKGKILVKTGWQDICTKFHRVHPETLKNCNESDRNLSKNDTPGHFKIYKCKNNLRDISTPIFVGGKKLGHLFFGQFFFEDEKVDVGFFREKARQYGFDEKAYISALEKIPLYSREMVENIMDFYIEELNLITNLSFNRIKFAKLTEEVKSREEQLRTVFETVNDMIFIKDKDLKYTRVNPALERIFNKSASKIINQTASTLFDEETSEKILENDKRVFKGETVEVFHTIRVKDALHSFYTIQVPLHDENGEITGLCGISRDITEMKQAENEIRDNRNLLNSIISALPGILLVVDKDMNIILANNNCLKAWSSAYHSLDEIRGKKCHQIFHNLEEPYPCCRFRDVLKTGRVLVETTTPDDPREKNTGMALKIIQAPLKNDDGDIIGVVEYGLDVTEIRNAKFKAEAANKAKTEFLATMSHELRTPLNGVIGFSEILKGTGLDENQTEFIDIVLQSAKNLLGIISDILDFSMIESNRLNLIPEMTDVRKLIKSTLEVVQCKASQKGLSLISHIDDSLPEKIAVDSLRFKQVLLNLLTNAIKFTQEGHVQVTVKQKNIDSDQKKINIQFTVSDTGIGIEDGQKQKIFEAFSQADMSVTRNYGGTGLGLAISKQLLNKMGSELQLTSVPGMGSDFFFELVLDYIDQETQKENQKITSHSSERKMSNTIFKGKKILLAEDDPINMKLARTVLLRFSKDFILIEANNGVEAYQLYLKYKPDLIFMDIVMPEVDGYKATKQIRQHDKHIPIVAMTAKALKEDKEKCLSAGMNDYITKPISLVQLKETLEKYFC